MLSARKDRCYIYLNSLWPIVTTYSDKGLGQIGWGNTCSLLTEGTTPLPKPMLTSDKIGSVAFTAMAQATILYNDVESNISQITVTSPRAIDLIMELCVNLISYTLSREYRMVRSRYSRLLFTSEDRLCANLRVQEQSTNMTSQCQ